MKLALVGSLFACAAALPARAGNVLVVGPGPTQIANIQAAIDAAIDGDVILVKAGTYPTFSIPNKELSIVGEQGQIVSVDGAMRVRNLTADRTVVLSGMQATGKFGTSNALVGNGFFATNCAGSIRVQDCLLSGFPGATAPCPTEPRNGAEVENCADVAFVRCTLDGSRYVGRDGAFPGNTDSKEGNGLVATGSSVALYDSIVRGGYGGFSCNGYADGNSGGDGVQLIASFLFASRTSISGGAGQPIPSPHVQIGSYAGYGGDGLILDGAGSLAELLQSTPVGGAAGTSMYCGICGSCCDGDAGRATVANGGTIDVLSGTGRALGGANIGRELSSYALTITGPPGDLAAIAFRRDTAFVWTPALAGVQLLLPTSQPTRYLILGTIPAGGVLSTTLDLPSIPLTNPGLTQHMQLVTAGSTPTLRLGSPLSLVIVDQSF